AIGFAATLAVGFEQEMNSTMLGEKLRGTGVGEPLGILNGPATITSDRASDNEISGADIVAMRARCWGYRNAIWLANSDTYTKLLTAHITGTNGDVFLFTAGNGVDVPDTMLGRPIFFTEHASTLGTK